MLREHFGALRNRSPLSCVVGHFFEHGGTTAVVVRVTGRDARGATGQWDTVQLAAASPGSWGNRLRIHVDHDTRPENGAEELFNVTWYRIDLD